MPTTLDVLGYSLDLQLTETQKETLGIVDTGKIRLKNSNGYSISPQRQVYDYDHKREKDTLLIDDKEIGEVYFTKNITSENSDSSSYDPTNKTLNVPKLDVPHPKDIFTYTCNKKICERVANTYSVNIDGVDFIPPDEFIIDCLNQKKNKYCMYMTKIGTTSSFNRPSPGLLKTMKEQAKNPEFNNKLADWEKDRLRKSRDKILGTINNTDPQD